MSISCSLHFWGFSSLLGLSERVLKGFLWYPRQVLEVPSAGFGGTRSGIGQTRKGKTYILEERWERIFAEEG